MGLTGGSERRKYKGGVRKQAKAGRPPKKLPPAAQKKKDREAAEAARLKQVSKLRSSGNDVPPESMEVCATSVHNVPSSAKPARGRKTKSPKIINDLPKRTTRASARAAKEAERPKRSPVEVELYTAKPSTPTKKGQKTWHPINVRLNALKHNNIELSGEVKRLKASNRYYQRLSNEQYNTIAELNEKLRCIDLPQDRPPDDDAPPPRPFTGDDIKSFVNHVTKGCNPTQEQMERLFMSLGLNKNGDSTKSRLTKEERKDRLTVGISTLIDIQFGGYSQVEQADIMGELAVNKLFGREAANNMACIIASSVNSHVWCAVELLKAIDCYGLLNDSGADDVARI